MHCALSDSDSEDAADGGRGEHGNEEKHLHLALAEMVRCGLNSEIMPVKKIILGLNTERTEIESLCINSHFLQTQIFLQSVVKCLILRQTGCRERQFLLKDPLFAGMQKDEKRKARVSAKMFGRKALKCFFGRPLQPADIWCKSALGRLCDSRTSYISSVTISASANNFLS